MEVPPTVDVLDRAVGSDATSRLIIEIAAAASGELDLDQILHRALDRLGQVVNLTGGSIALVEGDDLVIRAAVGPFADEALGARLTRRPGRSWQVIDTLEPYRSGDLLRDGDRITGSRAATSVRSWLAVPIVRNGVGIGLVEIDSTAVEAFTAADESLLGAVVAVLAGAMEVAAHHEEERRSEGLRDAFIGVISHELRTPVTTIYGLSQVLRRRAASLDIETRDQAIVDIEEEADRLNRLIEDLLVLSRAERGQVRIDPEPLNLVRLARRITDVEAERHPRRRYTFEGAASDLPLVNGEATYVEQVIRNYLSNAEKYSPAAMPIEVVVGADAAAGDVTVRVLDRGIGVDDETGVRAFDLFYRTKDATRVAHGAGIGLFVCRELIRAMGGRTWMEPRGGGGTEVGFSLPVAELDDIDSD